MVRVAPISVAHDPRALWFDPGDLEIEPNARVVVETARGVEFGRMVGPCLEVEESEVKALKSPLKPVLRVADDADIAQAAEMEERGREALPLFKEMAAELHDDMHPISVEFLLDGDKAVFYFEAEERVDFRELVRRLAAHFHVRIDMRQVGVRDEARMVGGLGHCGQELCCKRMGGEFCPVSIRMAKEQDLSLNPQKISGLCGRLMCCLRYEYEAYKDFKQRAPKVGAKIATPEGEAIVCELDVPREEVALKLGDEKPVKVPLSGFEEPEAAADGDGPTRPKAVIPEAWEEAKLEAEGELIGGALTFLTSQFTGSDKVAKGLRARRIDGEDTEKGERRSSGRRRSRSERGRSGSSGSKAAAPAAEARKPRRRRSTKIADGEVVGTEKVKQEDKRSSEKGGGSSSAPSSSGSGRTRRRRSSGSRSQGAGQGQQSGAKRDRPSQQGKGGGNGPRPGQRSSGLRNADARGEGGGKRRKPSDQNGKKNAPNGSKDQKGGGNDTGSSNGSRRHRRRRSRSGGSSGSGGQGPSATGAPKGDA